MSEFCDVPLDCLIGRTLRRIDISPERETMDLMDIHGQRYRLHHFQHCCESVSLDDITGELNDLLDSPIVAAYESSREGSGGSGSETWTFYHLATAKGSVTLRWYGTSNGYYSERVSFQRSM